MLFSVRTVARQPRTGLHSAYHVCVPPSYRRTAGVRAHATVWSDSAARPGGVTAGVVVLPP